MSRRRPYKLATRARLTRDPPFTPESLQATIGDVLGTKYTPPGDAEAAKLCSILNQWHAWFYEAQELREFNAAAEKAAAAIETLQSALPIIGRHHQKRAEAGDVFAKWQMKAVAELYDAVKKDPARVTTGDSLPNQVRDWRWLAKVLPIDIEAAIRPTNPRYRGGRSKRGPLARIVAAVIPSLTGENVGTVAVGLQLARAR